MDAKDDRVGLTKDAGWEVGVRKTVAVPLPAVWEYLVSDGLALWLGNTKFDLEKGFRYQTDDGVRGEVRTVTPGRKLRLTWQPDDWPHDTLLQVTVKEAATGTTIGFHHEQLADREERHMMLGHWKNVVDELARAVEGY